MNLKMPIGIENFGELIRDGYYFVDKTDFLRQLIDKHSKVTLITRPRRFGKTLTLSMVDWFFSIEKKEKSRDLFQHLEIAKSGTKYMAQCGQYPVLFISLKNIGGMTWQNMLDSFRIWISTWCSEHRYLLEQILDPGLQQRFQNLLMQTGGQEEMATALYLLMILLFHYYHKPVIVLIDEYDAPIEMAWENGFYKECITFMRQFLGSVLKTNEYLDFALLTGVLRVAKESIFSGLNNFRNCSVLDKKYSEIFGFTSEEVKTMLQSLGFVQKMPEVKSWYDGYRIGGQEIYNPWSVLSYIDHECIPKPYWVRTSANGVLKQLLMGADPLQITSIQRLLYNETIDVTIDESVIYPELDQDPSALFTLLLTTGYLTAENADPILDDRYSLKIPNKEIRKLYSNEILNYLAKGLNKNTFDTLFMFLFQGNAEQFSWQLQKILRQFVSTYDAANKESFYHGFMLGITALFLGSEYLVESNRESGYGRFDLAIFPKDTTKAGVILEFKAVASEAELRQKAEEAREQIEDRAYSTEFEKRGIRNVWKYGIAFCGKKVTVVTNNKSK